MNVQYRLRPEAFGTGLRLNPVRWLPPVTKSRRALAVMMLGLLAGSMAAVKPEMRVQVLSAVEPCRVRVKKGDTVYITHQGFLEESDGKLGDTAVVTRRQIDSNCAPGVERCEPLAFTVGARLIIRGMERAVVGVCQGETIEAHIPPHLAYDDPARTIPADSRPVPEVRVRARVRVRVSVRVRARARARVRRANPSPNPTLTLILTLTRIRGSSTKSRSNASSAQVVLGSCSLAVSCRGRSPEP